MIRPVVITVAILLGLGAVPVFAQWSPTTPLSFPAGFDVPLNASSVSQTKAGNLTVGSGYDSGTPSVATDLVINGDICWNSICRSSWNSVGSGNFAHLFNNFAFTPDTGHATLVGDLTAAITGRAGLATPSRGTAGVWAGSSLSVGSFVSTGAFGDTAGGVVRNDYGYAVYGTVGSNTSASAATFDGKIRVAWPYDLVIGPVGSNVQAARQNNTTSFVCIGDAAGKSFSDVCKSNWDSGGTSVWALNGTTVWPGSITHSVAVGGTGPTAKFLVDPHPDFMTDVSVSGTVTTQGMVIGTPSSSTAVGATCGDAICNGVESPIFGNPNFCAVDCDHTSPAAIEPPIAVSKNNTARTATMIWERPGGDSRGTVVIQKIGSASTSPTDGVQVLNMLNSSCGATSCTYTTPSLSAGVVYYYTFFVYDFATNYSTGIFVNIFFSGGGPPPPPPPPPHGGGL